MRKVFKVMAPALVLLGGFFCFYREPLLEQLTAFYAVDWRPVLCIALASAVAGSILGYSLGHSSGYSEGYRRGKRKQEEEEEE